MRSRPGSTNASAPSDAGAAAPPPSKTQRKKAMHDLQDLGEALATLPAEARARIDLPEAVRDAIDTLQRTRSHEARRRQLQYIGKLMRSVDPAPLREAVASSRVGSARATLALHRVEHWREQLLAGDAAIDAFSAQHPQADVHRLRTAVRAARVESAGAGSRQRRAYRELFQRIKEAIGDE